MKCTLLLALAVAGCETQSSRFQLQIGSTSASAREEVKVTLEGGQTRLVELFVVGSVTGSVAFSATGLPAFATLDGPLLTLAPGRADNGTYPIELRATAGGQTATSRLTVEVARFNSPPEAPPWGTVAHIGDDDGHPDWDHLYLGYSCPNPEQCTAVGTPRLRLQACDAEGDGIRFEVELVRRGEPFTGVATFSSFVGSAFSDSCSAEDEQCRYAYRLRDGSNTSCANVLIRLRGLAIEGSYKFAVRISDEFGAFLPLLEGSRADANGWLQNTRWGFDQGPCTTRQCACIPSGKGMCTTSNPDWCCSGVCVVENSLGFGMCQ